MISNILSKLSTVIQARLRNGCPWYERQDGTCNIPQPTLLYMGDDQPLQLIFPSEWGKSLAAIPKATQMAREYDALLVLMLFGEPSDSEMESLVLELVKARIVPLWIGEPNRKKFNRIVARLSSKMLQTNKAVASETLCEI